jgi:tripartite-type tricarboxylate transporter receptor subunit TctC
VPGLEDVPTLAETYPGFDYSGWFAVLAPTGTPREAVQRFNADLNRVLAEPEIAQRLRDLGLTIEPGSPEALNQFLAAERTRWAKLVKDINLQPE